MRAAIYTIILMLLFTGCADKRYTPSLYYWPTYSSVVKEQVLTPEQFDSEKNATLLIEDYAKRGDAVTPPGVNIYIAYLLIMNGKLEEAKKYFIKEAELFPESKVWIDNIIENNLSELKEAT
ncbi:MAG: DUF4810 domain-containing protein [Bdellovibrionota bacterium]|jgi:hypothetical protein